MPFSAHYSLTSERSWRDCDPERLAAREASIRARMLARARVGKREASPKGKEEENGGARGYRTKRAGIEDGYIPPFAVAADADGSPSSAVQTPSRSEIHPRTSSAAKLPLKPLILASSATISPSLSSLTPQRPRVRAKQQTQRLASPDHADDTDFMSPLSTTTEKKGKEPVLELDSQSVLEAEPEFEPETISVNLGCWCDLAGILVSSGFLVADKDSDGGGRKPLISGYRQCGANEVYRSLASKIETNIRVEEEEEEEEEREFWELSRYLVDPYQRFPPPPRAMGTTGVAPGPRVRRNATPLFHPPTDDSGCGQSGICAAARVFDGERLCGVEDARDGDVPSKAGKSDVKKGDVSRGGVRREEREVLRSSDAEDKNPSSSHHGSPPLWSSVLKDPPSFPAPVVPLPPLPVEPPWNVHRLSGNKKRGGFLRGLKQVDKWEERAGEKGIEVNSQRPVK
ncbi:hypothetical protein QFC19_004575 [Naganishia cerealis]|uniref:Uncharacterized protein n=1 Tax=Naganishia cerealis TaxID=610337 RepID=A0ACC2VU33_9TREE|nr:hypothetical protein QFC19_004575 [Naganishia cerealis]